MTNLGLNVSVMAIHLRMIVAIFACKRSKSKMRKQHRRYNASVNFP